MSPETTKVRHSTGESGPDRRAEQSECSLAYPPHLGQPLWRVMSIAWISKCWPLQTGSTSRKAVLMVLADHADEDGYCWPRVMTMVQRTELGERTVRRALGELESEGFIEVTEDYEPAGRQTSNVYRLRVNRKSPPVSVAGGRVPQRQGAPATGTGSTRTTNEPSGEDPTDSAAPTRSRRKLQNDADGSSQHDVEPPAAGAARKSPRKTTSERAAEKTSRPMTPARLAGRVAKALEGQFAKPVNIAALARSMREWELPIEMLTTMVEVFLDSPRHYLKADETPWVGFIRQRTVLLADAQKYLDSADPSAAFRADADDDEYDPGAEFRAG